MIELLRKLCGGEHKKIPFKYVEVNKDSYNGAV